MKSLGEMWDTIKYINVCIMRIPEGERSIKFIQKYKT